MTVESGLITRGVTCGVLLAALVLAACKNVAAKVPLVRDPSHNRIPRSATPCLGRAMRSGSVVGACLPLTLPKWQWLCPVAARPDAQGFTVNLSNSGAHRGDQPPYSGSGAEYGRDILGNFIRPLAPFVMPPATLVTIFAGANDVNTIASALGRGAGEPIRSGYINTQVSHWCRLCDADQHRSRTRAGRALVVLNLPNMAGMPRNASAAVNTRRARNVVGRHEEESDQS